MKPDEINKAIAETQGYTNIHAHEKWKHGGTLSDGVICGNFGGRTQVHLPNYYGSLDAIVPVVRALDEREARAVIVELHKVLTIKHIFHTYTATPAQWCEAYLKSKGLWNE